MKFNWNQSYFNWYGKFLADYHQEDAAYKQGFNPKTFGHSLHAISIPGNSNAYEIGVVKSPDGDGYSLLLDFWQGGYGMVAAAGGKHCEALIQAYSAEVVRSSDDVKGLVENNNCVEHIITDKNGDQYLVYEDEQMTDQDVSQFLQIPV